ncbi:MAG: helix-turn-helix domain-containing protein [Lachnospiraceae bacterium]|nr:helix-turn-helix domain-containing protein [Ruminococcus sp.]MCM1274593.1 helix-turn-helix domain-containing protein [Lachnospiraceae bacterium]
MDFNNLKLFRKQNGFTQEQVAEKLGVSRQAVAKWERGESLPDIENVIALADMYEVSVDSLVRNMTALSEKRGDGKHMFGITRVNDKGQITLPKKCREVFGINTGDALLLLGDEDRGIALVKVTEIFDK